MKNLVEKWCEMFVLNLSGKQRPLHRIHNHRKYHNKKVVSYC